MDYASWGRRAGGLLIDVLVGGLPVLLGSWRLLSARDAAGYIHSASAVVAYLTGLLITVVISVHNRWIRGGLNGRTWGRLAFGTRLVGESTDRPVGVVRAFLRDVAHVADAAPLLLGFLLPLRDPHRRTLADRAVGSVVVRRPRNELRVLRES